MWEYVKVAVVSFVTGGALVFVARESVLDIFKKSIEDYFKEKRRKKKESQKLADEIIEFIGNDNAPSRMDSGGFHRLESKVSPKHKRLLKIMARFREARFLEYYFFMKPLLLSDKKPFDPMVIDVIQKIGRPSHVFASGVLIEAHRMKDGAHVYCPIIRCIKAIKYRLFSKKKWDKKLSEEPPLKAVLKLFHEELGYDPVEMKIKKEVVQSHTKNIS